MSPDGSHLLVLKRGGIRLKGELGIVIPDGVVVIIILIVVIVLILLEHIV